MAHRGIGLRRQCARIQMFGVHPNRVFQINGYEIEAAFRDGRHPGDVNPVRDAAWDEAVELVVDPRAFPRQHTAAARTHRAASSVRHASAVAPAQSSRRVARNFPR